MKPPPDTLRKLRMFLLEAAHNESFRQGLAKGERPQFVVDLDVEFGVGADEINEPPPPELCKQLADWTCWLDAYDVSENSPPYDAIYVVVRHAMPLVPTVEAEDGASG